MLESDLSKDFSKQDDMQGQLYNSMKNFSMYQRNQEKLLLDMKQQQYYKILLNNLKMQALMALLNIIALNTTIFLPEYSKISYGNNSYLQMGLIFCKTIEDGVSQNWELLRYYRLADKNRFCKQQYTRQSEYNICLKEFNFIYQWSLLMILLMIISQIVSILMISKMTLMTRKKNEPCKMLNITAMIITSFIINGFPFVCFIVYQFTNTILKDLAPLSCFWVIFSFWLLQIFTLIFYKITVNQLKKQDLIDDLLSEQQKILEMHKSIPDSQINYNFIEDV